MTKADPSRPVAGKVLARGRNTIPTQSGGTAYSNQLDQYLDRLLDDALEQTFPASDPTSLPSRRELERK